MPVGQLKRVKYLVSQGEARNLAGYDDLVEDFRRKGTLVFWGAR